MKCVPYRNYLRALIYSGLSILDMVVIINNANMNVVPEVDIQNLIDECVSFPDGKKMRKGNIDAIAKRTPWVFKETVMDTFYPNKEEFIGFVSYYVNTKTPKEYDEYIDRIGSFKKDPRSSIMKLLQVHEIYNAREWFDCGLMTGVPLHKIRYSWNISRTSHKEKYGYHMLMRYYYFFWNLSLSKQRFFAVGRADIAEYLLIDPSNKYYDMHRFLIDKSSIQTIYMLGYMTEVESEHIYKQILGMLTKEMYKSFEKSGMAMPQWVSQQWQFINNMIREDMLRGTGPQEDIDEVMRIVQRIDDVHSTRRTLDDIRREEIKGREYVQDEAIDVTKR